ncbi:hypothetical protein PRZ48_002285 [Zasmidium cellare]|uniref:UBC core domain-containing protein n=1 Tax=Zasmidium cellare TaxID=395010 RepID=A0ABR0F3L0_ZASCE|nr:hypothetical protein PRZ48_002285 [Zasmidium cellare]
MGDITDSPERPRKRMRTSQNVEVVDLTDDAPLQPTPDSDEAYARELQRQFDAESTETPPASAPTEVVDADEAMARALQAEWDAEEQSSTDLQLPRPGGTNGEGAASASTVVASANVEFQRLLRKQCETCRNPLLPTKETQIKQCFKSLYSGLSSGTASIAAECIHTSRSTRCSKKLCFGCGTSINDEISSARLGSMTVHCNDQRLALICILLCGYDTQAKQNKPPKARKSTSGPSYATGRPGWGRSTAPSGTGYGDNYDTYHSRKRGGSHASGYHKQSSDKQPLTIAEMTDEDDKLTAIIMETIADLLPSFERFENPFDADPPTALAAFLGESSILNKAAELLRNSSLDDISARAPLYHALVRFVNGLAGHFATGYLVYHERVQTNHNLLETILQQGEDVAPDGNDTTSSLADSMKTLADQCDIMLKDPQLNAEEDITLHLYQAIRSMAEHVQANLGATQPKQKDPNSWQKDFSVLELSDDEILNDFYFQKDAKNMRSYPTRMKRIVSELSTLRASLPDGIFIRYAESRPDCMKILIVGPQDTPYADGLFEFDLLCPDSYPAAPPKMQLKTTGRGTTRFNPNLYANGKVCLSLLGTWSGPGWSAHGSTILQVLVSIQSMIFNGEPYTNEPGWASQHGSEASKQYNRQTQTQTVEVAMLGWLEQPGQSVWTDIMQKHFNTQKDQILKTVTTWTQDRPQTAPSQGGYGNPSAPWMGNYNGYAASAVPQAEYYPPANYSLGYPLAGTPAMGSVSNQGTYAPAASTASGYSGFTGPGQTLGQGYMPGSFPQPAYPPSGYRPPGSGASSNVPAQQDGAANGLSSGDSLDDLVRQLRKALPELKDRRRAPPKMG